MFSYKSKEQLSIFDFRTPFENELSADNRWVILANLLDWDGLASIYAQAMSSTQGSPSIDARIVIGALIIKHLENKDDRGTIEIIQENPYMQYFIGLDGFTTKRIFDPSLFVHIRKRLSKELIDKMNQLVIEKSIAIEAGQTATTQSKQQQQDDEEPPVPPANSTSAEQDHPQINDSKTNKGRLQLDATVADAYIQYPTDLNLLNESREKTEGIIDSLYENLPIATKPRTYRKLARKAYLKIAKKKQKSRKAIRKGIKAQLGYVKRNLGHIDNILSEHPMAERILTRVEQQNLLTIKKLYQQQLEMYTERKHQIDHRIVSISQPHIRPIVRGKEKHKVEFGAKLNVSLQNGYARINQLSFEAYNESTFLTDQVEDYKTLNGYYPEVVQTDNIYLTKANRAYLKERNIRHTGKPLGRKPKETITASQKRKQRKEKNERNQIEGKFGQGKASYGLNKIKAKLPQTQESWIASILFIMNILKLSKDIFVSILNYIFYSIHNKKYQQNIINYQYALS